jgi:thiol-disulfide isomerase/thioredoxin
MLTPEALRAAFEQGLKYTDYVATGSPEQQVSWTTFHGKVKLAEQHQQMLNSFSRQIRMLVLSGTWCGDCVHQVPMLDHLQRANPRWIELRIVDRDEQRELSEAVKICGGRRVPTVLFLNEDFEFVGLHGDQVLARFRAKAAKSLGASCPLPGADVPADEIAATLDDWARELERAHLLVRLSAKLRERHGD